jgi:hypothetical protein
MKYLLPTALALSIAALAGCERPASTSSTTVVQPTKETVVQRDVPATPSSSTTIVNPPAAPSVTVDTTKPETTTERSRTTTTERVDTPAGTATRTETSRTTTTK